MVSGVASEHVELSDDHVCRASQRMDASLPTCYGIRSGRFGTETPRPGRFKVRSCKAGKAGIVADTTL